MFVAREFQAETEVNGRSDVDVFFLVLHREAKTDRIIIWRRCFEMLDAADVSDEIMIRKVSFEPDDTSNCSRSPCKIEADECPSRKHVLVAFSSGDVQL